METVSLKIGPSQRRPGGGEWSLKIPSEIYQIRISHDTDPSYSASRRIKSLQLLYLKDGQLIPSDIIGDKSFSGPSFQTIKLCYPAEYITCVEGDYLSCVLSSLFIETNMNKYGPFGLVSKARLFEFKFGPGNEFGGFHGSHDSSGVTSIGVYLNPPKISPPPAAQKHGFSFFDDDD